MTPDCAPHCAPNCAFVLDNGQPCRCPARHGHRFCRHHTPDALDRRRAAAHPLPEPADAPRLLSSPPEADPWGLRAYWRMHHRIIAASTKVEALDDIFQMVVGALGSHEISPRSAGRLLAAVLDRKQLLAREAQAAALRALEEQFLRRRAAQNPSLAPTPQSRNPRPRHSQPLTPSLSTLFPAPAPEQFNPFVFAASQNYPVRR